jgi:hydroxymethylglutaryl-CoA lyase
MFKILETPRDAMQGLERFIPTKDKITLINSTLKVGFDIVDVGSFVSPKAIPQMADIAEVMDNLDFSETRSKIFALVASVRGGHDAAQYDAVDFIGFPFSTSHTFLKRNINSDFRKAEATIDELQNICIKSGKKLLLYFSMAFGNPYNDSDDTGLLLNWTEKFKRKGIEFLSLSDITSVSTPGAISNTYKILTDNYPNINFGLHLHIKAGENGYRKIEAAYQNGCSIFEGVINGLGGCPMTGYEMIGNMTTGTIVDFATKNNIPTGIDPEQFEAAKFKAMELL